MMIVITSLIRNCPFLQRCLLPSTSKLMLRGSFRVLFGLDTLSLLKKRTPLFYPLFTLIYCEVCRQQKDSMGKLGVFTISKFSTIHLLTTSWFVIRNSIFFAFFISKVSLEESAHLINCILKFGIP